MKNIKLILWLFISILIAGLAWYSGYKWKFLEEKEETNVNTILERIDKVMKLVSVEGQVSEIYDYKSYKAYDLSPFRKKILIRVNAKVLIGFDLEKVNITTDEAKKMILIKNFPEPEVLSIDHDLDYYDIQEGTFNHFSEEELTQLNKNAKEYASSKALTDEMYQSALEQKNEMIALLNDLLLSSGWQITVDDKNPPLQG